VEKSLPKQLDTKRMKLLILVVTAAIVVSVTLRPVSVSAQSTQTTQSTLPLFEAATVLEDHSGESRMSIQPFPRYTATNLPLKNLLLYAFGVMDFQIAGVPDWVETTRYDIDAKLDDATQKNIGSLSPRDSALQVQLRVQSLLAERFGLKFHHEAKELPVYALVVAKAGVKLKPAKPGGVPPAQFNDPEFFGSMSLGRGYLDAQCISMTGLASNLSANLGRIVLDLTGVTGKYDVTMKWKPEATNTEREWSGAAFTAMQDQLGLNLIPQNHSVDVIVIDHIERPSGN
jgi:uncharacterized protein (TIGR03435 family)